VQYLPHMVQFQQRRWWRSMVFGCMIERDIRML